MNVRHISVPFTWQTTPYALIKLAKGEAVRDIGVAVEDAFNGPVAFLTLGTIAEPERVILAGDVNLRVFGDYRIPRTYTCDEWEEHMYLVVEPGASTGGHGRIFYTWEHF